MPFNTQSNFQNGLGYDAWFGNNKEGIVYCATDGNHFVKAVQVKLRNDLPDVFDSAIGGSDTSLSIVGSRIQADGQVGRVTLGSVHYAIQNFAGHGNVAPADWLRALSDDYRAARAGQPIDRGSLKAMIWFLQFGIDQTPESQIILPVDTRPPLFMVAAPVATGVGAGQITCWREGEAPPHRTGTTGTTGSTGATGTLHDSTAVVPGAQPWTTGEKLGAVLAGTAIVLAGGALIMGAMRRPAPARRAPGRYLYQQ